MDKRLYQSRFAVAPTVDHNRSKFNIPYTHLTTANFGKLVPFYWQEILPGDTFDVTTKMLARMSTPIYPVMDNAFIDYYYFFVPNRLVWSHWAEFMGENKLSAWVSDIEYTIPHAKVVSTPGGRLDHFGIPTYSADKEELNDVVNVRGNGLDINFLPIRAYELIWNEWFRNENTTDPVLVNTGDNITQQELDRCNILFNVAKYFDYFTSALPSPQKGDAVDIPLGDFAPLVTTQTAVNPISQIPLAFYSALGEEHSLSGAAFVANSESYSPVAGRGDQGSDFGYQLRPADLSSVIDDFGHLVDVSDDILNPANLVADLSKASTVTVNALRQSFQMQRLLELQARSGSRYIEIIKASFGVLSPDARLQRPEYLGGCRTNVMMQQITQQSATDSVSPLGTTGAYSKTISAHHDFNTSFTEHGYIIGVMCARTAHTYQQGLNKMWSRRGRYDYYWPTFAHIGEQPILRKEIYATGLPDWDEEPFGYQEAWAEYRYKPNEVTGAFRSTIDGTLDSWHYADYYLEVPYLSAEWMEETVENVDRTLVVESSLSDQLIFDIRVDAQATRVMPLYSIPGLIDHM